MKATAIPLQAKLIFAFLILVFSTAALATELSGTPNELRQYLQAETRTVVLSEEALETAYADTAEITLVVATEEDALAESIAENKSLRDRITADLRRMGIAADDINTSKYSASPQYGWFKDDPKSFQVVNSLVVKVTDENLFQQVAGIADQFADVQFAGAKFSHSEKDAYVDMVRDKALDKVTASKGVYEKSLGLTLTPVTFSEGQPNVRQREQFAVLRDVPISVSSISKTSEPSQPPSFDEIEYRMTVTVTYAVKPAGS